MIFKNAFSNCSVASSLIFNLQTAKIVTRLQSSFILTAFFPDRFHASRYPTKPSDTTHKFDSSTHNHVVFIRKNKFFLVPLADASGRELSAAELETYAVSPFIPSP